MWVVLLILKIILYLLAALLLILVTFLVVPFTYKGEAEVYDGVSFNYKVGWFWNLFNIKGSMSNEVQTTEVCLGSRRVLTVKTKEKAEQEPKTEKEVKDETKKAAKKENNLRSLFDTKLIKEALNYLKKVVKQISPRYLQVHGTYGFDDPSLTGMTAGFVYTLQGLWPQSKIHLQPSFVEEIFEIELKAAGSISAGRLAWDTARFLLKKDIRTKIFKRNKKVKHNAN